MIIVKKILNFCGMLANVRDIPTEMTTNILSGLMFFIVDRFKQTFDLFLNWKCINEIYLSVGLDDNVKSNLSCMKSICINAVTYYNLLCTYNEWNMNGKGLTTPCWNYGEPHRFNNCKDPKDKKNIERNKMKFMDKKKNIGNDGSISY